MSGESLNRGKFTGVPRTVIALGFVSLFMDTSSELIHSLLPVYLTTVLGVSALTVGVIEGVAEATASITKVFSGVISDYLGRRKLLLVLGYGLAALTKPMFPLSNTASWVLTARFTDRIGKGIRGAPRDALVADVTPPESRGAAYGLRQSLDTAGAFAGPLLALTLMALLHDNLRQVLWIAVIPAVISVVVLVSAVRESTPGLRERRTRSPVKRSELRRLGRPFLIVVIIGALFSLARFSEAFLVLRAATAGLGIGLVPLVLVVMNIVYFASAYPAGWLSDRISRHVLLAMGLAALILSDLLLAGASTVPRVLSGAAIWGLHMGFSQGILVALVADAVPAELRGTAFGIFNLVSGFALLGASLFAGWLWEIFGPQMTFHAGAGFALLAMLGLLFYRPGIIRR